MKFSTCLALFSITLALATTGCRYNKSAADGEGADGALVTGANGGSIDMATSTTDFNVQDDGSGLAGAGLEGGSLADFAGKGTFAERGYTRCTDVSFAPVYFGFDATSINPAELGKVEAVAQHLAANPDRVVTIEGNCDERGSNEYNLSLGDDRALMIANFLAQNGIGRERMETLSRGETNPAVAGSGEGAWSQNRRGEFIIWKK